MADKQVGDFVQMNHGIHDHDIVKYVDYEITGISARCLTLRNTLTEEVFTGRHPDCFFLVDRGGPW